MISSIHKFSLKGLLIFSSVLFTHHAYSQGWQQVLKDPGAACINSSENKCKNVTQEYGCAVAAFGDYAIVGAKHDEYDASQKEMQKMSGACYILKNTNGVWKQQQKIVASDRAYVAQFGSSVAMHGNYVAVSAPGKFKDKITFAGAVYVFKNTNDQWIETQKLDVPDLVDGDKFGSSIAMNDEYLLIGSPWKGIVSPKTKKYERTSGAVYVFKKVNDKWEYIQKLTLTKAIKEAQFGTALAISGNVMCVGASGDLTAGSTPKLPKTAGSVFVFQLENGKWVEKQKLISSTREVKGIYKGEGFGQKVSMYENTIIVGAPLAYDKRNGKDFHSAGAAFVFEKEGEKWIEKQKLKSTDGNYEGAWYGTSVSIYKNQIVIGAPLESSPATSPSGKNNAGLVYIYKKKNSAYELEQKIESTPRKSYDEFGRALAIYENAIIVGGRHVTYDTTAAKEKVQFERGAAYVFVGSDCPLMEFEHVKYPKKDQVYSHQIKVSGLSSPKFSVTSGTLPDGLSLSESGLLSGTPTKFGGAFVFTITATEGTCKISKDFERTNFKVMP